MISCIHMLLVVVLFLCGFCGSDYSFVQISDIHCGYKHANTLTFLSEVVKEVNSMIEEDEIKFAIVTGDISHYGNNTEMKSSKQVLDGLKIPYFPTLGNHDIYGPFDDKNKPTGGYRFSQIFSSAFSSEYISHYTGNVEVKNPDIITPSYFQNYQIDYGGLRLLSLDYNARIPHVADKFRASPGTQLFDFEGGTWEWMKSRLNGTQIPETVKSIVFALHHPFYNPIYIPKFWKFGWSDENKKKFEDYISQLEPNVKNLIYGDLSGHLHKWEDKTPFKNEFEEHVSNAIKNGPIFLLVKVSDGKITELKRFGNEV